MADSSNPSSHWIAPAFNFRVSLKKSAGSGDAHTPSTLTDGGFQECTGLEIGMDVKEHQEGGRNDGVIRLVGRGTYQPLVLKRGMFHTEHGPVLAELWSWLQDILSFHRPSMRYDGIVEVLGRPGGDEARVLATWTFTRGLPMKVVGPRLDAARGDLAVEELHIAHEGLRLEVDA